MSAIALYPPPDLIKVTTCDLLVEPGALKVGTFERRAKDGKPITLQTKQGELNVDVSGISYAYDAGGFIALVVVNDDRGEHYYELDAEPNSIPQLTYCGTYEIGSESRRGFRRVGWHIA